MLTYDYYCRDCCEVFEVTREYSEVTETGWFITIEFSPCPKCGQEVKRRRHGRGPEMKQTGREKVLASLNSKDDGIGNKPHIKNAMWKGLHQDTKTKY